MYGVFICTEIFLSLSSNKFVSFHKVLSKVSLDSDTMTSCDVIPGVRISFLGEESAEFRRMICEHPDFLAALERRGISDPEQVLIEGFAVANLAEPEEKHLRHKRQ